jgi:ubiquinone/menaquinone biosynthesis C-methylase UbiE
MISAMERITELELMIEEEQARAYAEADFDEPHQNVVNLFEECFPGREITGAVLDIGCGPGDVTFRFARRFPEARFVAVDGSPAMLGHGRKRLENDPQTANRITFVEGCIPGVTIPYPSHAEGFDLILSTSFLHHLHDPSGLWTTVRRHARSRTLIFVVDLLRPESAGRARELVETYAAGEPEVLRNDFYNSLCAAFTPGEIRGQLEDAGLTHLRVRAVSDRHLAVWGAF